MRNKTLENFNKQLVLQGYAETDDPTIKTFMNDHLDFAHEFGIDYTVKVRVHFKVDTCNCSVEAFDGLLRSFEHDFPYHLYLRPKYISKCSVIQLKSVLTNKNSSPLKDYLKENKEFRKKVAKTMKIKYSKREEIFKKDSKINEIFNITTIKINQADNLETLNSILKLLDFSAYSRRILKNLEIQMNILPSKLYNDFSFIVFDQISKIDIISYETPYSLEVTDDSYNMEIPLTHVFSPRNMP